MFKVLDLSGEHLSLRRLRQWLCLPFQWAMHLMMTSLLRKRVQVRTYGAAVLEALLSQLRSTGEMMRKTCCPDHVADICNLPENCSPAS
jgi:hypothetical protein